MLDKSFKKKFKFKEIPFVFRKYHIGQNNTSLKKNYDYKILHIFNKNKNFLSPIQKILAKNHFRYLLANSINKKNLKLNFFFYLFLQKNIKISKVKIIIKIFVTFFRKIMKIKICCVDEDGRYGGPQSRMIDVYKNIDLNKITYDFLIPSDVKIFKKKLKKIKAKFYEFEITRLSSIY